jgi:hypothetical protein
MGTKNNPGKWDCYANAEPDEPIFVLLARDKHAPALVRLWAALREHDGEDESKVIEALGCVGAMLKWQADHDKDHDSMSAVAVVAATEAHGELVGLMKLLRSKDSENAE